MNRATLSIVPLLAACGCAWARGGEALLLFDVTTADGDALIETHLGESSCEILVSCAMTWDGQGNRFEAFMGNGDPMLNILGDPEAARGAVGSYTILNDLNLIVGDTTVVENEDLLNITLIQNTINGYWDDNPIALLRFTWETTDLAARRITYSTDLSPAEHLIGILVRNEKNKLVTEYWPGRDAQVSIEIVPAPGVLFAMGLAACISRRHRS